MFLILEQTGGQQTGGESAPVSMWATCAEMGWPGSTRMATCHTLGPEHTAEIEFMASSDSMRRELSNKVKKTYISHSMCIIYKEICIIFCGLGEKQLMLQKDLALSPRLSTVCGVRQSFNIWIWVHLFLKCWKYHQIKSCSGVCKKNTRWTYKRCYVWGTATRTHTQHPNHKSANFNYLFSKFVNATHVRFFC